MRRLPLLALLAAALAAGCVHEAPGACADDAGCRAGEHCAGGVCLRNGQVALGGACELQAECASWATCAAGRCALRPGACEAEPHCAAWQDCGAAHACVLAPGMCDGEGDCAAWKGCVAHGCVLDAGRCDRHGDCAGWQYCDAGHTCRDVGASCAGDGDCQAWQTCTAGHCANRPGACGASEQCEAWQVCDASHACTVAPGSCATSMDCPAWETCGLDHVCAAGHTCATDADCLAGEPCVVANGVGACSLQVSYDGRGVTIFGTLLEGLCGMEAFAPLNAPTRYAAGAHCHDFPLRSNLGVTPGGAIVYKQADSNLNWTLARFVKDPLERELDGWWVSPTPHENDVPIPTPACTDVGQVVMQAGTGALLYTCVNGWDWFDTEGNLVAQDYAFLGWNAAGLKIAEGQGGLWLLDASHARVGGNLRDALPFGSQVKHARAHGDGFRLLVEVSTSPYRYERWYVAPGGAATRDGTFATPPSGVSFYWTDRSLLDASGAMYGLAGSAATDDVVPRCELEPGDCRIVYDEGDAPEIRWDTTPARLFVFLHGSYLITGP